MALLTGIDLNGALLLLDGLILQGNPRGINPLTPLYAKIGLTEPFHACYCSALIIAVL